ncbi:RnfABCDGE type electron transport complex subunit B [Halorhodospira neutriphila]|uniref:Ion-translocating oxidoreductase complex subunit B n=1 Tax=Halorhodospira neutriphila TaxID=168379 RepID=A0ABS1E4S0_9GAMM|nr:RnfABCDGE type electron transport complex subunit B [Halorhodospira neutriphila]MBK1726503.1 electron transporter RnfB [Halorhodospira neutriphila]
MYAAMLVLTALAVAIGWLLAVAHRHLKPEGDALAEAVEEALPGTNCGQCGYPGCAIGAAAVAAGELPPDFCPPGGRAVAEELARLTGRPLSGDAHGGPRRVARVVDEGLCIGCLKCLRACPTDAIIGAPQQIHGVLPEACSGCTACIDVCPTETLQMVPEPVTLGNWRWPRPAEVERHAA